MGLKRAVSHFVLGLNGSKLPMFSAVLMDNGTENGCAFPIPLSVPYSTERCSVRMGRYGTVFGTEGGSAKPISAPLRLIIDFRIFELNLNRLRTRTALVPFRKIRQKSQEQGKAA